MLYCFVGFNFVSHHFWLWFLPIIKLSGVLKADKQHTCCEKLLLILIIVSCEVCLYDIRLTKQLNFTMVSFYVTLIFFNKHFIQEGFKFGLF